MNLAPLARASVCWIAMVVVLVSGVFKLADLPGFEASMATWNRIPDHARAAALLVVPALELAFPLMWFAGVRRRTGCLGAIVLMLSVSGVYAYQAAGGAPVRCGCLVAWPVRDESSLFPWRHLAVNAVLTALLACGVGLRRAGMPGRPLRHPTTRPNRSQPRTAFTMIETILVVALVGLLVALVAPSIGRAREHARHAASLSNLRHHAAITTAYATDWSDSAPYGVSPESPISVLRCPSRGIAAAVRYFDFNIYWNISLAEGYYDADPWSRAFRSPALIGPIPAFPTPTTSYALSCTFLASPEHYNLSTRQIPPIGFRAVRLHEVLFPGHKSFHADRWVGKDQGRERPRFPSPTLVGFVDGHAERIDNPQESDPGDGRLTLLDYNGHHLGRFEFPYLHTFDGVRGRDID
ncbi:MAG: DoxX family protein [Phycisphaeraceae bacterium]|nr:MAG: DoxX family protein [Phycisphaeraceae bacterium]